MPYPENFDHHFVVDPTKFDFYAMDCYRHLAAQMGRVIQCHSCSVAWLYEPGLRVHREPGGVS